MTIKEHIIKTGAGYKLVSKKTGKNLGTATTKAGIMKRERQVQYFKHMNEDAPAMSAGAGGVAGIGIANPTLPNQAEPGVKKVKRKVMPLMGFLQRKQPVNK
jgi:hypothetical protein